MCQKRSNVTIAKRPAAHANEEKKKDKTSSELKHYIIVMSNVFKGLFFISVHFGPLNRAFIRFTVLMSL